MLVGDGVDDGHRPGEREFQPAFRMRAGERRLARVNRTLARERAGDGRAIGDIAVVANDHLEALAEIDDVDALQEAVDEMLARLLALVDDVDARVLLFPEDE